MPVCLLDLYIKGDDVSVNINTLIHIPIHSFISRAKLKPPTLTETTPPPPPPPPSTPILQIQFT